MPREQLRNDAPSGSSRQASRERSSTPSGRDEIDDSIDVLTRSSRHRPSIVDRVHPNRSSPTDCPDKQNTNPNAARQAMQSLINGSPDLPCFIHLSGATDRADLIAAIKRGANFIAGRGVNTLDEHDPRGWGMLVWLDIFFEGVSQENPLEATPKCVLRILFLRCVDEVKLIQSGTAFLGVADVGGR